MICDKIAYVDLDTKWTHGVPVIIPVISTAGIVDVCLLLWFVCSGHNLSPGHLDIKLTDLQMQGDWNALGDVLYRKWHVYDMGWGENMQIEDFHVCGAPFGGPLALIRDDRKPQGSPNSKPKLRIFTSSGNIIAEVLVIVFVALFVIFSCQIEWSDRRVVGMGWSDQEQLVVVLEDGTL